MKHFTLRIDYLGNIQIFDKGGNCLHHRIDVTAVITYHDKPDLSSLP